MPEHLVSLDQAPTLSDGGGALKSEVTDDDLHPNAQGSTEMESLAQQAVDTALAMPGR